MSRYLNPECLSRWRMAMGLCVVLYGVTVGVMADSGPDPDVRSTSPTETSSAQTSLAQTSSTQTSSTQRSSTQRSLRVIASIRPLHSLVSSVMLGIGEPDLLVDGNASPHTFSLKPSSARLLQDADIVFWIGPGLETFLKRPLMTLASEAQRVALMESLSGRQRDDTQHERNGGSEHAEHGEDPVMHRHAVDAHIWLNPDRAIDMLDVIAKQLGRLDPNHAEAYQTNAKAAGDNIEQLSLGIEQRLKPFLNTPYIVFHDAYGAFEERFSITQAIPFLLNPEARSGADRIQRLRSIVREKDVRCLFTEPQFDVAMADVLAEGSEVRRGVLDPLGSRLDDGPGMYDRLLTDLVDALVDCLQEA